MARLLGIVCCILLCGIVGLRIVIPQSHAAASAVSCEGAHQDANELPPGKLYEWRYVLRNDSPSVSKLEVAATSCSCITGEVHPAELNPGEYATVTLRTLLPLYGQVSGMAYVRAVGESTEVIRLSYQGLISQAKGLQLAPTEVIVQPPGSPQSLVLVTIELRVGRELLGSSFDTTLSSALCVEPDAVTVRDLVPSRAGLQDTILGTIELGVPAGLLADGHLDLSIGVRGGASVPRRISIRTP